MNGICGKSLVTQGALRRIEGIWGQISGLNRNGAPFIQIGSVMAEQGAPPRGPKIVSQIRKVASDSILDNILVVYFLALQFRNTSLASWVAIR